MAFRFVLKLPGVNAAAVFTSFIYGVTYPFVTPFLTIFKITQVEGVIFEWITLLVMLAYIIVGMAIVKIFVVRRTVSTPEAALKLKE